MPAEGHRCNPAKLLLDPYARAISGHVTWGSALLPYVRAEDPDEMSEDDSADVVRGPDGIWRVKAGARIRVTVTMTAPARRVHVALVDPMPAGWEPINPALRGNEPPETEGGPRPIGRVRRGMDDGRGWWWRWWWFEHQNLRDDRAEAFTSLLPAGEGVGKAIVRGDALSALMELGYGRLVAEKAIRSALKNDPDAEQSVESMIKSALREMQRA